MTRVTTLPPRTVVPARMPWLRTVWGCVGGAGGGVVVVVVVVDALVEVVGPPVDDVVVVVLGRVVVALGCVVVVVGVPTEKQAQFSPARWSRWTAWAKVRPVTSGTSLPLG